ncbi:MAG: CinA family protein [Pseudomonadota bacterium]
MNDSSPLPPIDVLAERIGATLRDRQQTVAVAESSAGGLVSAALLAVPGASAFYRGGAVVYTRYAFRGLLDLGAEDMVGLRAETEPYAALIAGRIRDIHRATWGLGESGAAGPSPSPYGDAPGHVCVAVAGTDAPPATRTVETGDTRRGINMEVFARQLLWLFDGVLHGTDSRS